MVSPWTGPIQPALRAPALSSVATSAKPVPQNATPTPSAKLITVPVQHPLTAKPWWSPVVPATKGSTSTQSGKLSGPASSGQASEARQMIHLINQARIRHGLQPYTVNPQLTTLAQERAKALVTEGFTSDLPGYGWPAQMEQKAGIRAQGLGAENIALAANVSQAFQMLMASPPHRQNILNPYETQIGVGVAPDGNGIAVSELFIGPNY